MIEFGIKDALDIFLVASLLFYVYRLMKESRSLNIFVGIMPVYDALYDYRDRLNHILVRHEQAAAHAAEGYARVSGQTGVCLVTSGPGATNTITGIADAMMDSTPMVVIMGQVGAQMLGTDAFQECDMVDITQPICKWAYQIRSAKDVAWAVHRAFYIAGSGRPGPVVLDFAKNAQLERAEYVPVPVIKPLSAA